MGHGRLPLAARNARRRCSAALVLHCDADAQAQGRQPDAAGVDALPVRGGAAAGESEARPERARIKGTTALSKPPYPGPVRIIRLITKIRGTSGPPQFPELRFAESRTVKVPKAPFWLRTHHPAPSGPCAPPLSLADASASVAAAAGAALGPPLAMPTMAGRNTRSPIM